MGFFSDLYDDISDLYDDISGKTERRAEQRREWKRETKKNVTKARKEIVTKAQDLWSKRNYTLKGQLVTESERLLQTTLSLQQFNGVSTKAVKVFSRQDVSCARASKSKISKCFGTKTSIAGVLKYAKKQFPYSDDIYYQGVDDEFLTYLDGFMRKELKGKARLTTQWDKLHKSALEIRI
jgi:hypothetical protein